MNIEEWDEDWNELPQDQYKTACSKCGEPSETIGDDGLVYCLDCVIKE